MNFPDKIDAVRIRDRADVRRAAIAFREAVHEMFDCRIAACDNIALKQRMRDGDGANLATEVFGWTDKDKWLCTPYLALGSPLTTACRFEPEPFWVNAEGFRTRLPNSWLDEIDLSDFEKRALTRAAIVVPVHLPFGQIGSVSFTVRDPARLDLSAEYEAYADMLGLYSRTFITSYQRAMVKLGGIPANWSLLSKREVECLSWAAVGKTDVEISMIISRSRATVRFHIMNAGAKLNAVNRSQTVFKAAQLGYIGLNS